MSNLDVDLLLLIPHNHIDGGVSTISVGSGIVVRDGQTIGRIELVKSIVTSCKRRRHEIGAKAKCSSCDFLCQEGSKYLSRKMMTFRSRLKESIIVQVKDKMISWMKHNDQSLSISSHYDGTVDISLNFDDSISFRLPDSSSKNTSWISFTVRKRSSVEMENDKTLSSTVLQSMNHDEKSVSSSSSSSTSVLEMPYMAKPFQLDLSMSLNLTMGTSAESQESATNLVKSKILLSKLSVTQLNAIRKRWEIHESFDEDFLKEKNEFKCFLIDIIMRKSSEDGDYEDNCSSLFRKTVT
jgi:hypothetical protein